MPASGDLALAKLIGYLYTEVFQKRPADPNKPLNRAMHLPEVEVIADRDWAFGAVYTVNQNTVWGPGGQSDTTSDGGAGRPTACRWSFFGTWG